MKLYLAGPMTGYDRLNYPLFHAEAARLRTFGFDVVNPAEINVDPSKSWCECMRADLRELVGCDAIAMLPGWEKSRGATLEHHVTISIGVPVFIAADLIEFATCSHTQECVLAC